MISSIRVAEARSAAEARDLINKCDEKKTMQTQITNTVKIQPTTNYPSAFPSLFFFIKLRPMGFPDAGPLPPITHLLSLLPPAINMNAQPTPLDGRAKLDPLAIKPAITKYKPPFFKEYDPRELNQKRHVWGYGDTLQMLRLRDEGYSAYQVAKQMNKPGLIKEGTIRNRLHQLKKPGRPLHRVINNLSAAFERFYNQE